jgi:hypothetical protein
MIHGKKILLAVVALLALHGCADRGKFNTFLSDSCDGVPNTSRKALDQKAVSAMYYDENGKPITYKDANGNEWAVSELLVPGTKDNKYCPTPTPKPNSSGGGIVVGQCPDVAPYKYCAVQSGQTITCIPCGRL